MSEYSVQTVVQCPNRCPVSVDPLTDQERDVAADLTRSHGGICAAFLAPFCYEFSECSRSAMVKPSKESKAKAAAKATASEVANGSQATLGAMPGPGVSRPAARSHELALTVDVKKEFEDRTQIDFRLL